MKLEDYMLPCLNKKLLGFDCPGCGIQRSVALITKGEFEDAFYMYPAIYTLIILAVLVVYNYLNRNMINSKIIYRLAILNVIIIVTNFFLKLL